MEKFEIFLKKSAIKQLRSFPPATAERIQASISFYLTTSPFRVDGKHIKKLLEGYRLRVGDYRVFYFIEKKKVIITSIVRRTSTTY